VKGYISSKLGSTRRGQTRDSCASGQCWTTDDVRACEIDDIPKWAVYKRDFLLQKGVRIKQGPVSKKTY